MLYLTCTTITSVDLAHYGVSHAKDWVSQDCGISLSIEKTFRFWFPLQQNYAKARHRMESWPYIVFLSLIKHSYLVFLPCDEVSKIEGKLF